jgi:hypothetical protein
MNENHLRRSSANKQIYMEKVTDYKDLTLAFGTDWII